jgi:hypothetical protein
MRSSGRGLKTTSLVHNVMVVVTDVINVISFISGYFEFRVFQLKSFLILDYLTTLSQLNTLHSLE